MINFRETLAVLALAAACACAGAATGDAGSSGAGLHSRADGKGTTTYWGDGAHYEIRGPGVTLFFLKRDDEAVAAPLMRVAYVGDGWINVRSVTFVVGERVFGPYADGFGKPARIEANNALVVETLVFRIDSDEKWQMLDGIAEASELGRPVVAVFEADAPYGIEVDQATKRATRQAVLGFRSLSAR